MSGMSEPTVTSTSSTHSAPISKPKQDPHSVAHETVPPESRPVGSEEHGTTGPDDAPPGAPKGEQYPPQIHAGKVGYGPHYAEVHGKDTGFGAKLTGVKEQIKGKITRNHELEEKGRERRTGELAAKEREEDDTKNPFQKKDEEEGAQNPAGSTDNKDPTEKAKENQFKPGASRSDTEGAPTAERIPSSTAVSTTGAQPAPTTEAHGTPSTQSQDIPTTKPHDTPITKPQGAPTATAGQEPEGTTIRH